MSLAPQIWIADSARGNGVQNLVLGVQNEFKIMIQFLCWKLIWEAACLQPSKFELRTAQKGRVYKIWDVMHKIVQNKYKIMIYFSF